MKELHRLLALLKSDPDIVFFSLFLLSAPLSIRKVLFYFPIAGTFNEYTGFYLYLSDIPLFLVFLSVFPLLRNIIYNLSSKTSSILEESIRSHILIPVALLIIAFVSIGWSENKPIAIYRAVRLLVLVGLYFYSIYRLVPFSIRKMFHVEQKELSNNPYVPRGTKKINLILNAFILSLMPAMLFDHYLWDIWPGQIILWFSLGTVIGIKRNVATLRNLIVPRGTMAIVKLVPISIILSGTANSIIGILQFITQHSLGLRVLGESFLSPEMPGVAKIVFNSHKLIRAYGLFPHPNILGGYLLLSVFATFLYKKMFRVEQKGLSLLLNWFLYLQIIGLFLTFSKSALLGIAVLFIFVPRGTMIVNVATKKSLALITTAVCLSTFLIIGVNKYFFFIQSLKERLFYLNVSRGTIESNPILGVGMGESVNYFFNHNPILASWEYQPVHNVFLLAWAEIGLFGLILFICLLGVSLIPKTNRKESLFTK